MLMTKSSGDCFHYIFMLVAIEKVTRLRRDPAIRLKIKKSYKPVQYGHG